MLCFLIIGCLTSWVTAQNSRGPQHLDHNGHGWDIRLAVPGNPGNDYPTLNRIPRTTFSCAGREPGYYADTETNCQVFRVCTVGSTYGFQSFLCPNGTLFNQAVFVCDWWMNVNCENSGQFVRNENKQFENLRLGPQLMKDIKKMLTHPMRNPYDKIVMKSNFIVMQDYKPPAGQLFPNGALWAGPERAPTMVYVPKQNLIQNYINSDTIFLGSTSEPKYTTIRPTTFRNTEIFQKQHLGQYTQSNKLQSHNLLAGNTISNGHTRQYSQYKNAEISNTKGKIQPSKQNYQRNIHKSQRLTNLNNSDTIQTNNVKSNYRGQLNRQNNQNTVSKKSVPITKTLKPTEQFYKINQEKQPNANITSFTQSPYELAEEIQNEVKQNVVSKYNSITPTVTTKTLAYSRIIENPQPGKPKSKITVKTWIIKPTRSSKLIASPSSHTYNHINEQPNVKNINETAQYVYEKPTTQSQPEKIITNPTPYTYARPTISAKQIITTKINFTDLNVPLTTTPTPRSTVSPKLKSRPKLSSRLDVLPTVVSPTHISQLYFDTTTSQPSSRLYLPPQNTISSRQYLSPIIQPPVYFSSNQLSDISTSPTPIFISEDIGAISLTTEMPFDSNLIFTDVLTKDKINKSVNTIVKDTNDILRTASPLEFSKYDQNFNFVINSEDDPKTYSVTDSGESLTSQLPTVESKSARTIRLPSTELEPPDDSFNNQNINKLSQLPYFKESLLPPANTIERTVSLRITIPENVASYLFKKSNLRDYDKLEILNTDNSNYLVLSNNLVTPNPNFIPLGKLIGTKNTNISNSQALVFSLLADSINAAKEYSNIAQQDVLSSTSAPTQFQNINNEELSQITNKISQLTTSQFLGNNNNRNANIVATPQTSSTTRSNQPNIPYTRNIQAVSQQAQQLQNNFTPLQSQTQKNYYPINPYQLGNNDPNANLLANNDNQIYSGQLYKYSVPDVTNQIYNRPLSSDLTQPSSTPQNNIPTNLIPPSPTNAINFVRSANISNRNMQSSIFLPQNQNNIANLMNGQPSFEIVQSKTLPYTPTKEHIQTSNEPNSFNQETLTNLLNSDNGISAQLLDKIVGTIPHPIENNKLVTYENNQSYFFTTNLDHSKSAGNSQTNSFTHSNVAEDQNIKPIQNNIPNALTFQLIPSVGYQLDSEKDQQQILNTFRIDEFGAPRDIVKPNIQENNQVGPILTTNVGYSIDHSKSAKQTDGSNDLNALYSGPSSYFPSQASIGNLGMQHETVQNNFSSRLEDLNGNIENGYPKTRPTRQFTF